MDVASNNEANVGIVNVGIGDVKPTVNIELKPGEPRSSIFARTIEGVKRAIDPVGYERERGEAAMTALDYELAMVRRVREEFPFMSDERARLYAHGLNRTEAQAGNFEAVVEKAETLMDAPPKELPEPAVEDAFADAMCDAYDEEVQDMLARALVGEFDSKGSVSRNTLSIVKRMDRNDVLMFEYFCSLCSGGKDAETPFEVQTVPCIAKDGPTYRELPYEVAMHLDSLGLVSMASAVTFGDGDTSFCIDGKGYHSERVDNGEAPLKISDIAFTVAGTELSAFFDKGTHPKLREIVSDTLGEQGFELKPYLKLVVVANLTTGEGVEDLENDNL